MMIANKIIAATPPAAIPTIGPVPKAGELEELLEEGAVTVAVGTPSELVKEDDVGEEESDEEVEESDEVFEELEEEESDLVEDLLSVEEESEVFEESEEVGVEEFEEVEEGLDDEVLLPLLLLVLLSLLLLLSPNKCKALR